MSYNKLYVKFRARRKDEFQFFKHQAVEAALNNGFIPLGNGLPPAFIGRGLRKIYVKACSILGTSLKLSKKKVLITSSGGDLMYESWPYFHCEIIPLLWDCWPESESSLYESLQVLRVKEAFFTQREVARKVAEDLGIKTHWVPEGIDIRDYDKGQPLSSRVVDLYELGRQMRTYHSVVMELVGEGYVSSYKSNTYSDEGKLISLAYPTAKSLIDALPQIKIIVSFPKSLTDPITSGGIETLTQRYWEGMLSRSLVVGHCPKELYDILSYNPVVEVDWSDPKTQLMHLLAHIEDYQELVDRNYEAALKNASWEERLSFIAKVLRDNDSTK